MIKTLPFENLKLHIIVWTAFIVYEMFFAYSLVGKTGNLLDNLGHYSLNIAIFYFNAHVVLPNTVNYNKPYYLKIPSILSGILGVVLLYVVIKYIMLDFYNFFHIPVIPAFTTNRTFIISNAWRGFYFIGLSTGYWFALSTIQNRKKIANLDTMQLKAALQTEALEKTLLTTENAYLKSQINPHFLLNTLNFLYNSVAKYSDKIADSVMTLADIMRYALTNADDDGKVKLELEIEHISNFIKLNQARFSERLRVDMVVEGDTDGLRIIPLVLITLAENVFKYGDLLNESYPAKIIATVNGNTLIFVTQNLKKKKVAEKGHGIGIQNVKSRLAIYHPFDLAVEDNELEYKSTLKIQL
jgi:two-component system LytT family sensor kinase